jgi:hypothetical protein
MKKRRKPNGAEERQRVKKITTVNSDSELSSKKDEKRKEESTKGLGINKEDYNRNFSMQRKNKINK